MKQIKINILELKEGDNFQESQIYAENSLQTAFIIGEHLYLLTDGYSAAIVCADNGNGHGTVLKVIHYSELYKNHLPHANIETDEMKNQKMLNFWPFA